MHLRFLDVVLKTLPLLAALATAVVSLLREKGKHTTDSSDGLFLPPGSPLIVRPPEPFWTRLRASGWILIALAITTCVAGVWSGLKDVRDAAVDAGVKAGLVTELQNTKTELQQTKDALTKQVHDAQENELKASRDSEARLTQAANQHARELRKQQELTFISLLSSVTEPSQGIMEIDIPGAITDNIEIDHATLAELNAEWNYQNWRPSLAFFPIYQFIEWTDPVPIEIGASLGDWPKHDSGLETSHWGAGVAVWDRKGPPPSSFSGSLEIREFRHLIIRMPTLNSQPMLDLWRGPRDPAQFQLHIWIHLRKEDDRATRLKIEALAGQTIKKVTAYYTISARSGLCKRGVLNRPTIYAGVNQLRIQFNGAASLENVQCPDYVIGKTGL